MKETTKADKRRFNDYLYKRIFVGKGIDIGCGDDSIGNGSFKSQMQCECFDIKDGDAQEIHLIKNEKYDFVYSSNCLEHLKNPILAFENWLKIVKVNGFLVVSVPDEDLYEQGRFPSKFNPEHLWSFTILKNSSWSQKSINVVDLLKQFLPDIKILRVQLVDQNYDYSIRQFDQTRGVAEAFIEFVVQRIK
jgi:SAM-dependent methyltransferase